MKTRYDAMPINDLRTVKARLLAALLRPNVANREQVRSWFINCAWTLDVAEGLIVPEVR